MASKGKGSKRSKGSLKTLIGFLLAGTLLFALVKGVGASDEPVLDSAQETAPKVEVWIRDLLGSLGLGDGGSGTSSGGGESGGNSNNGDSGAGTTVSTSTSAATKSLDSMSTIKTSDVGYDRDEWRHWSSAGSSCWNVREEVLYRQAADGDVTLLDRDKNVTKKKSEACYITGGTWHDPYTGKTFTNPSDLDIDHMVPLGYAARHGGQEWSEDKKKEYANSMDDGHLLAVFASANRQKSDEGPADWKPQKAFQCDYAKNWISVSTKWKLSTTAADKKALASMLKTC